VARLEEEDFVGAQDAKEKIQQQEQLLQELRRLLDVVPTPARHNQSAAPIVQNVGQAVKDDVSSTAEPNTSNAGSSGGSCSSSSSNTRKAGQFAVPHDVAMCTSSEQDAAMPDTNAAFGQADMQDDVPGFIANEQHTVSPDVSSAAWQETVSDNPVVAQPTSRILQCWRATQRIKFVSTENTAI